MGGRPVSAAVIFLGGLEAPQARSGDALIILFWGSLGCLPPAASSGVLAQSMSGQLGFWHL